MRFLVDQNLPTVLCDWLIHHGQQAEHIKLIGMRDASDTEIIRRARETNAVIVTRDSDFVPRAGGPSVATWFQLVWVRLGNVTNPEFLAAWSSAWPTILAALEHGDPLVEVE